MSTKSLVSILIPAYNAEKWIADTIRSALAQTWPNKEIIIVDDGSTDRTLAVARQFSSGAVSIVTQKNQGAAAARNKALEICQGDYIQWLDADDLLSRHKTSQQMSVAEEVKSKRIILSCEWAHFRYRTLKAKLVPSDLWCDLSPREFILRKLEQNLYMQTATWLISRELTNLTGPWDLRLMGDDDGEYFCRALQASDGVRFVPGAKVFYRITSSSSWGNIGRSERQMEAQLLSMKLQIGCLRSMQDDERVRKACLTYLQNWLGNFYPERPDLIQDAQQLAAELGGKLEMPRLRWKYAWIRPIFGYNLAKRAQLLLPEIKSWLLRSWDKTMFRLEGSRDVAPTQ
jgi:hypothetical protein